VTPGWITMLRPLILAKVRSTSLMSASRRLKLIGSPTYFLVVVPTSLAWNTGALPGAVAGWLCSGAGAATSWTSTASTEPTSLGSTPGGVLGAAAGAVDGATATCVPVPSIRVGAGASTGAGAAAAVAVGGATAGSAEGAAGVGGWTAAMAPPKVTISPSPVGVRCGTTSLARSSTTRDTGDGCDLNWAMRTRCSGSPVPVTVARGAPLVTPCRSMTKRAGSASWKVE
jgi:hypothetical protein